MNIVKIRSIFKNFGEKEILKGASLDIRAGDKIGLVGYNGTGKTTLLRILAGVLSQDSGSIDTFGKQLTIGYLQQSVDYTEGNFASMMHGEGLKSALEASSRLGFKKTADLERERLRHLSGGEKLKLALSEVWAGNPQLLILDEPTNHLDLQGVNWLVDELAKFHGAAVIVSHDRYFLDRTANRVEELAAGKLESYTGNYTAYREEKKGRREAQQHQYEKQQKYKDKIEEQIDNLKGWSDKAHNDSRKKNA